jgi:sulfur carrier protein
MNVTAEVLGDDTYDLSLEEDATYGDVLRAVGLRQHEATVVVGESPVPEDAPVEVHRMKVLRLIQGG